MAPTAPDTPDHRTPSPERPERSPGPREQSPPENERGSPSEDREDAQDDPGASANPDPAEQEIAGLEQGGGVPPGATPPVTALLHPSDSRAPPARASRDRPRASAGHRPRTGRMHRMIPGLRRTRPPRNRRSPASSRAAECLPERPHRSRIR